MSRDDGACLVGSTPDANNREYIHSLLTSLTAGLFLIRERAKPTRSQGLKVYMH